LLWREGDKLLERRDLALADLDPEWVTLGAPLDASYEGGGGRVFAVVEYPHYAAKMFTEPRTDLPQLLELSLARGLDRGTEGPAIFAAPFGILSPSARTSDVGFTMRRVPVRDELARGRSAAPKTKELRNLRQFRHLDVVLDEIAQRPIASNQDLEFFVRVARSLARSVADLHSRYCVVGDLKPENLFVHAADAYVFFVDVDAFSFFDETGASLLRHNWTTEGYRAPELNRGEIDSPTYSTDCFSLAVIVAQLLLCGFHPFGYNLRDQRPRRSDQSRIDKNECWLLNPTEYKSPLRKGFSAFPAELSDSLRRALTTKDDRPPVAELADLLDRVSVGPCGWSTHKRLIDGECCQCEVPPPPAPPAKAVLVPPPPPAPPAKAVLVPPPPPPTPQGRTRFAVAAVVIIVALLLALVLIVRLISVSAPDDSLTTTLTENSSAPPIGPPVPDAAATSETPLATEVAVATDKSSPTTVATTTAAPTASPEATAPATAGPIPESTAPPTVSAAPPATWGTWDGSEGDLLASGHTFRALYIRSRVTDTQEMCIVPANTLSLESPWSTVELRPCDPVDTPQTVFVPMPTPNGTFYEVSIESNGARYCLGATTSPGPGATKVLTYDLCSGSPRDLLHVFVDGAGQLEIQALIGEVWTVVDVDYGRSSTHAPVNLYLYDRGLRHQRFELMWVEYLA
jgi:serine/threonine protein kinase